MFYFRKLQKEKERQRASIFWFILSDGYSSQSWVGSKLGASSRCLTKLQGPKHLSHALLLPQAIGGIGNGAARDSNGCLYDMPVLQADQSPKPLCQLLSQFVDRKSKQHGTSSGEELLVASPSGRWHRSPSAHKHSHMPRQEAREWEKDHSYSSVSNLPRPTGSHLSKVQPPPTPLGSQVTVSHSKTLAGRKLDADQKA